ncbi:hypothetical protein Poli38472_006398 [Pythium oligandrum]|uniref:5'-nucleotidase n=1 Tax=Pythium oligandrum TaxID=41045 RepID=A0A8K1C4Q4_PYTOL|nr:hypothetical protein Poli38472_006398 [Pythium oligandrum]|eukprot:TMW56388.1 hypothetical protein Poli38472_006398 [Pythium oligandrum]
MKIFRSFAIALVAALAGTAEAKRNLTASLEILAYNDVYELLQDSVNGMNVGGPSRVVPIAEEMRAKNPNSLVLFAGDTMSPSLWSTQFHGMQMVEAHNRLGVDYATLGNHEFDFGIEGFLNVSSASNFPWLNANTFEIETGALLRGTEPRAVRVLSHPEFGTIKIGFFGVMYDMKDSSKGLFWSDPLEAAKRQVDILRNREKVDMVIALTHQDLADDNRLSKDVKGVDLIIAGHDHTSMLQTNFGAPYLKADFDFRSIWRSKVDYFKAEGSNTAAFRMDHHAVQITEDMKTDAKLDAVIDGYTKKIGELFKRQVGTICEPLDLSNKVVRAMDAPIGHVFADAQLNFYGEGTGDVSLMNGGGIRTDRIYPAGDLTLGDVMGWSPFGNMVMIIETDGASLKKFITKEMLGSCGAGVVQLNGFYVHTAGIKYAFKCTGSAKGEITSIEWFEHPTRTGPVQDTDKFKTVLSDYLYNTEFMTIPGVSSTVVISSAEGVRIDAALEAYVKSLPNAELCEKGPSRNSVSF